MPDYKCCCPLNNCFSKENLKIKLSLNQLNRFEINL